MRVLIIGGTGLISQGIARHLLARGAAVSMLNRGRRAQVPGLERVEQITADREDIATLEAVGKQHFDVVIDMICFTPEQARSDVRAFGGRCGHFIFCSTVCTYGVKVPPGVFVDETFPQEPISEYGRNKLAAEDVFRDAHAAGTMPVTIIRPSHTYGPDIPFIDNIEADPVAWDRISKGLPIFCGGDGLGLWVSTHRDDCGKLFAHAAMNERTFGQEYNATTDRMLTWRDYLQLTAAAIGERAKVLFMPAGWIIKHDPKRFSLLKEITQFHGAYDSSKARRDVPEFVCDISFSEGVAHTLAEHRQRGIWRRSEGDTLYEAMIQHALAAGMVPEIL